MSTNGPHSPGFLTADGILTVDENGTIESLNAAAARIFAYPLEELCGQPLALLLPTLASPRFDDRLTPYLEHPPEQNGHRRLEGRSKVGNPVLVELAAGESRVGARRLFTVLVCEVRPRRTSPALDMDCDLLEVLMDNLPDAIYFKDAASRFIQLNRALARRFGLTNPADAEGKSDFDFFTAEHAQQAYANEQEMIRTGQPVVGLEEKETWPDGHVTWASTTKMPLRDRQGRVIGTFGISRDITDRKRAEEDLRNLSRFLDSVIENLPIMLFVKDAEDLRFERLNKAGEELLGFPRSELVGKNDYDLFPRDEADFFIAKDRDVLEGEQLVDIPEEVIQTRRGERILHTRKIPLFDEHGRPKHLVGISEDITQAKQAELALQKAKQAAEAANRAKSEFLANVSHEIRTPMNGILGMTELALDTDLTPQQREFLSMVKASADALLAVINDILDFSKIESGKFELERTSFPLRDSLGDTMKTLALRAHKKGLELACQVLADVPDNLLGDPGRLRQIVVNLVGNAIKFTETGEVVTRVALEADGGDHVLLHFAVRDTGIGIARDKQAAIFAPFVQADGSTTRKYGGTGLGLAISARLVELMGGRIWVESEPGRGSVFHFTARFGVEAAPAVRPVANGRGDLEDLPVLVVDDNATNRRILEEMLSNWQMRPTVVESGAAALAEMERAVAEGDPFALVLLDAQMPQMDGYTLARRIHEHQPFAGATIMMLSSGLGASRDSELPVAACLMKPIKQSELFDAIMTALGVSLRREEPEGPEAATSPGDRRTLRVLLAEDNAVNQRLVVHLLEKRGHQVAVAGNGREAIDLLTQERFDVVLMDVQMPEMGGFEATAAIRQRERQTGGRLPIVAMTAHAMKGDRERCLEAGMDGYVSKPVQAAELFAAIEGMIASPAGAPERGEPVAAGVDLAQALDKLAGDEELLHDLVRVFLEEWPRWRDELNTAGDAGDCERMKHLGHTVRSAMGQFGVGSALEAAERLENLGRQGDLAAARAAAADLQAAIELVAPALEAYANTAA